MWHKRRPVRVFRGRASYFTSKTVSRVLYLTVIYLGAPLPARSSHLLRTAGPAYLSSHGVAPDRVYSDGQFPAVGCALTAPFHPYHCGKTAVIRVKRCPRPIGSGPLRRGMIVIVKGKSHRPPFTRSPVSRFRCAITGNTDILFSLPARFYRNGGISLLHFS